MTNVTIDQAFAAALTYACDKGGYGFQARIAEAAGVDTANLSGMKKGRGASEDTKRAIFAAILSELENMPAKTYDGFLAMGLVLSGGCGDEVWAKSLKMNNNVISGSQTVAANDCHNVTFYTSELEKYGLVQVLIHKKKADLINRMLEVFDFEDWSKLSNKLDEMEKLKK